ncbi:MAG: hypothetical protein PHX83_14115 [Acidobacteriia bacterium]|nr:hypothetical protein [Terriglobia bacterium]
MRPMKWAMWLAVGLLLVPGAVCLAQNPPVEPPGANPQVPPPAASQPPAKSDLPPVERHEVIVPRGTHVPMQMMNYVSTKTAKVNDPIYLQTMFPITVANRVVIPIGSYVRGTITEVERSGRVKGRAKMYVRFDSLTLPNGATRDFNATVSQADPRVTDSAKEGQIEANGSKGRDAATVATTGAAGAGIGGLAGISSGHSGMGTAIGAGAGALAGLIGILATRGNEVELYRGTEVDMMLDRDLIFDESELTSDAGRPSITDRYNQPTSSGERKRNRPNRDYRDPLGHPIAPYPY